MVPRVEQNRGVQVGIDISLEKFDVCIRVGQNKAKAVFPMSKQGFDEFRQWLKRNNVTYAELWMEATGRYYEALAEWAHNLGWKIVIGNPRSIRYFAKAKLKMNKTDPLDAEVILRFAETSDDDEFHYWLPRSASHKALRDLQLEIAGLKKMMGQERNRLKCGLTSEIVKGCIRKHIEYMQSQIKVLRAESKKVIKADPEMFQIFTQLKSIKGISDVTIGVLLWKIDFAAFQKGRQLVKYAGLDAVAWQSGKTVKRKSAISRVGHGELRSALYLPAVVAMSHDADTKRFAENLEKQKLHKKAIICAVMARLLRVAFARVRDEKKRVPLAI